MPMIQYINMEHTDNKINKKFSKCFNSIKDEMGL